jgi:cytochrome c-type biogenesis protein CcmH/NrfG
MARADRAFGNLRYDEAIVAWEQVLQLADERDPRRATAASGVDRATRLLRPR